MRRQLTLLVAVGMLCCSISTVLSHRIHQGDWVFPWDECTSMDQIVGRKCEVSYYICDFGDQWFTREVLCNNCIGDCPPGRVFDNGTETCVWPNTIGCSCSNVGQIIGTECENKYYICELRNGDWATKETLCSTGLFFDLKTNSCKLPSEIGCRA